MHLWIHSNASYINGSKAFSCNCGFFYLSENPNYQSRKKYPPPKCNAPVLVSKKTIHTVTCSVQESEPGSGFINVKDFVPLCNNLHEMGHIEGLTPIQFENLVTNSIITDTVVQHRSKAIDIRFYWLCDQ